MVVDAVSQQLLLPALPLLRARLTMRLLDDALLPPYKGGMLRGGFGYAFKRSSCPQPCWNQDACAVETLCPYRWIFETPHPPEVGHLHDLRDVPRPFVIEPPLDRRTHYKAGETIEWTLTLIGGGITYLAYFLFGFEQLGRIGLGAHQARARLERVEALRPWEPVGEVIYQDGRALPQLPSLAASLQYDAVVLAQRAAALPADLRIDLRTPLRVKTRGDWMRTLDMAALVQALCWRINALATFHGDGPWNLDYRPLVEQAKAISIEQAQLGWEDWERTSRHRATPQTMKLGGLVGSAIVRGVSADVRAVLLLGSLVHVGKACVFGHGEYHLKLV
jgi:hypothetical protein